MDKIYIYKKFIKNILYSNRNFKCNSIGKFIKPLEKFRLNYFPRNVKAKTNLFDKKIYITDAYWYLRMVDEIIAKRIYFFDTDTNEPNIIDCGANIGVSVIFFKLLYPNCKIIAFEPDPSIFKLLKKNISSFNFNNVNLQNKAVWDRISTSQFLSEGTVGGKLVKDTNKTCVNIETVNLGQFINDKVDFLKIDIEGAEYDVMIEIQNKLKFVKNIFLEFHGKDEDHDKFIHILNILRKSGFNYYIKESSLLDHPFIKKERARNYTIFYNIFGYRK